MSSTISNTTSRSDLARLRLAQRDEDAQVSAASTVGRSAPRGDRSAAGARTTSAHELPLPAPGDATEIFRTGPASHGPPVRPWLLNNRRMNAADGALFGAPRRPGEEAVVYRPGTPLENIRGINPVQGRTNNDTIVLINGMTMRPDRAFLEAQEYANRSGSQVVGLYNATNGVIGDYGQIALDRLGLSSNPAVTSAANLIYDRITNGQNVHIMGRSQGGLILQRALQNVRSRLEQNHSPAEVERMLGRVNAETIAGAGINFPDGPRYVHYVNDADSVVTDHGLLSRGARGGRDARYIRFSDQGEPWPNGQADSGASHRYQVYSRRYLSFEEAYRTGRTTP